MGAATLSPMPLPPGDEAVGVGVIQQHNMTLKLQVHASLIPS